ncbi:MAG: hypothetical protein IJZ03_08310 [Clostridia bacterium]|nr:hypothetical protein [Clostridia bacterium]
MNATTLILLYILLTFSGRISSKLCGNIVEKNGVGRFSIFFILNGIFACLFFTVSSRFNISVNLPTLLYSLAYATVVILSLVSSLKLYSFASIGGTSIITSSCALVATSLIGALLFSERITILSIIKIILLIFSVVLVFFDKKSQSDKNISAQKKNHMIFALLILLSVLSSAANTIVTKYFTLSSIVTDENSFFFLTNLILVLGSLAFLGIYALISPSDTKESLKILTPKAVLSIGVNTFSSNLSSLVSIFMISKMAVIFYAPLTTAVATVVGFICSLLFKERPGIFSYVAAAISVLVILI